MVCGKVVGSINMIIVQMYSELFAFLQVFEIEKETNQCAFH